MISSRCFDLGGAGSSHAGVSDPHSQQDNKKWAVRAHSNKPATVRLSCPSGDSRALMYVRNFCSAPSS